MALFFINGMTDDLFVFSFQNVLVFFLQFLDFVHYTTFGSIILKRKFGDFFNRHIEGIVLGHLGEQNLFFLFAPRKSLLGFDTGVGSEFQEGVFEEFVKSFDDLSQNDAGNGVVFFDEGLAVSVDAEVFFLEFEHFLAIFNKSVTNYFLSVLHTVF